MNHSLVRNNYLETTVKQIIIIISTVCGVASSYKKKNPVE